MTTSTPAQLADRTAEIRRLLAEVVESYSLVHDMAYRKNAAGEVGRSSGEGRPTETIALSKQRDWLRKKVWGADEAMKDAAAAVTLARDELAKAFKDRQTWTSMKDEGSFPVRMKDEEHKALLALAQSRRARGEE